MTQTGAIGRAFAAEFAGTCVRVARALLAVPARRRARGRACCGRAWVAA